MLKDAALLVREWTQRGDNVQLIERFEGDQMPEWICRGEPCYCEAHRAAVKTHGLCDWWARRSAQR